MIPGTKNTVNDLLDLKASGMAGKIQAFKGKIPIFGICGGYQMLGRTIYDSGVENGVEAEFEGLGLLNIGTKFGEYKKRTIQVTKKVNAYGPILAPIDGEEIKGYEIHMGITDSYRNIFGNDGAIDETGLVIGTYLHVSSADLSGSCLKEELLKEKLLKPARDIRSILRWGYPKFATIRFVADHFQLSLEERYILTRVIMAFVYSFLASPKRPIFLIRRP